MRKPVLLSFGVLIGMSGLVLAMLALSRLATMDHQAPPRPASGALSLSTSYPIHYVDAFQREIVLPAMPQRIISLAPSLTELIFALGAGDRLVADTRFCVHPPEAVAKEKIGGIMDPDLEKIVGLHPDLLVGTALTPREVIDEIDRLGVRAAYFRHTSVASVYEDIVNLATLLGVRDRGEKMVAGLRARGDALTDRLRQLPPSSRPKVLLLLRIDGLYSAGKGSFPNELIEMAGGVNVAAQASTMWPQLSMETVMEANPDVIMVAVGHGNVEDKFLRQHWEQMRSDPHWHQIKAVIDNRLVLVPDDLMTIPGPRLMDALEAVAAGLHPDLFKQTVKP